MTLEPENDVVWKGSLWSDVVFTAASFKIPSSALGLRVYLELVKADEKMSEFVPCSELTFNGRPDFLFTSKQPASFLGQKFTKELSSVCDFLFDNKCIVGAKVHRDVLIGDFVFLRLVLIVAMRQVDDIPKPPLFANTNDLAQYLRDESSRDANLSFDNVDVVTFKSEVVR